MRLFFLVFIKFFFVVNLSLISNALAQSKDDDHQLAFSKEWLRLLYYEKKGLNKYKSEVFSQKFFLKKQGLKDPLIELQSFIEILKTKSDDSQINDEHPICRFPARFFWINQKLKLFPMNIFSKCLKMNEFMNRLQGQSASMVFSSYFVNNPSSAFGHTFLKINKDESNDLDLLNYGINYAATVDTKNAFFYALKGLLGFFPGEFTATPFYYKVREYNDYESRDLWEYQLNLSAAEMLFLNLHIWELGSAWSKYYFLDKNCSYWAIRVLEAIKPDLNLADYFSSTFVVPIETVKSLLKSKDLVKNIRYRPSLRQQLLDRFNLLNTSEIKTLTSLTKDLNVEKGINWKDKTFDPHFLKTLLLYFDYTNADDYVANEDALLKKKQPLLLALSQTKSTPDPVKPLDLKNAPHLSHPPRRFGLGYKTQNFNDVYKQGGLNLKYKLGFHDILDSNRGFNPHLGLNYLDTSILLNERQSLTDSSKDNEIILNYLHILSVESFTPINKLESKFSWRFKMGLDSEQYLKDWTKTVGFINFDSGVSKSLFKDDSWLLYFFVSNTLEVNGRFKNKARYGVAPLFGFKYNMRQDTNLVFETKPLFVTDFSNAFENIIQTSVRFQNYFESLSSSISLDADYLKSKDLESTSLGVNLNYYF